MRSSSLNLKSDRYMIVTGKFLLSMLLQIIFRLNGNFQIWRYYAQFLIRILNYFSQCRLTPEPSKNFAICYQISNSLRMPLSLWFYELYSLLNMRIIVEENDGRNKSPPGSQFLSRGNLGLCFDIFRALICPLRVMINHLFQNLHRIPGKPRAFHCHRPFA